MKILWTTWKRPSMQNCQNLNSKYIMRKLILLGLLAMAGGLQAQQVTNFAGRQYVGDGSFSGSTGSIAKADDSFSMAWSIAVDTGSRYWITDQHNVSIIIGSLNYVKGGYVGNPNDPGAADYADKTGTVSRFANPAGCDVNPTTNTVVVADADNNVIRTGSQVRNAFDNVIWSTLAGKQSFFGGYKDGSNTVAEFSAPEDVAVTSAGVVYVADRDNHCIRKISGGNVTTIAGLGQTSGDANGTGSAARFYAPTGLYLINDNTLLVADRNNGKIKKIDLTNNTVTTVVTGLNAPEDMVQVDNTIYITDSYCIRTWDGSKLGVYAGKLNVSGYANAATDGSLARFSTLKTIDYNPKNNSLFVADLGNNIFRQITVSAPPVADFTADKTAVTVNEIVTLTNKSTNAVSIAWTITPGTYTIENGGSLTDNKILVSFQNVGSYAIELTATNPTGSNKKSKVNYINVSLNGSNKPVVDFIADNTNPGLTDVVTMMDQSSENPMTFAWVFTPSTVTYQNGTTAASRFPKVKFNNTGKYTVQLTVGNGNGTNNKTRTDYINVVTTGTDVVESNGVVVYPNPASQTLYLSEIAQTAVVTNINGTEVAKSVQSQAIDISNLADGIYFIQIVLENGKTQSTKFVKQGN